MNRKKKEERILTVKELPAVERPYEKLRFHGEESLSDVELLAILLRSGTKKQSVLEVAKAVLYGQPGDGGLQNLRQLTVEQLAGITGIGTVKAIQLKAVAELAKRLAMQPYHKDKVVIRQAADVARYLQPVMQDYRQEVVKAVFLNTRHCIIRVKDVFVGGLSLSAVHPRELFAEAICCGAAAVIVCHNHPSGDATPSRQDIETTERLVEAGALLGISVLDHLVFGDGTWESILPYMLSEKRKET